MRDTRMLAGVTSRLRRALTASMNKYFVRSNSRVLWVDDCPESKAHIASDIERRGVEVSYALSTNLALTLLGRNRYLAVISDVGRPEGQREAFDLLDRMRARGDTTPFFFFFAGLDATPLKEEILLHDAQGSSNDSGELKRFIEELLLSASTGLNVGEA